VRETGWYLKDRTRAGNLKIAVFDDRVPFYAGATAVMLSAVKEQSLKDFLQTERPNYLAVESKTWQKFYPHVARQPAQSGLSLEKEFIGVRKDRMLLFKVAAM
jgi:hypothetical protein